MINRDDNPEYLNSFLDYSITILNKSPNSIKEYNYDIAMFLKFIKEHLTDRGYAFITVIGDGEERYSSDKDLAFDDIKKINVNTNEEMDIASTSCRIVDWDSFLKEITECGLKIIVLVVLLYMMIFVLNHSMKIEEMNYILEYVVDILMEVNLCMRYSLQEADIKQNLSARTREKC